MKKFRAVYARSPACSVPREQALCMSPTRELAIQTTRVLQQLAAHTGHSIVSLIGGVRYSQAINANVVVGTPGKLQDVLKVGG